MKGVSNRSMETMSLNMRDETLKPSMGCLLDTIFGFMQFTNMIRVVRSTKLGN